MPSHLQESNCTQPSSQAAFPLAEAQLVALFMQSVTYGIHVLTFGMCAYTWFRLRGIRRSSKSWPWKFVAVALFLIGTLDVSFNLYHNLFAFIIYEGAGGAECEFEDMSVWVNVIRSVWSRLSAAISDAALIYRCWVIYTQSGRQWVTIAIPSILWLGATACAVMDIVLLSTLHLSTSIPDDRKLRPYLVAYYVISFFLNVLATGMIVYRIWHAVSQTAYFFQECKVGHDRLRRAIRIFVESAALYTLCVAVSVILELAESNAYYGTSDVSVELAGIAFDLIIIRIWQGDTAVEDPALVKSWPRQHERQRQDLSSLDFGKTTSPIVVALNTVSIADAEPGNTKATDTETGPA